MSMGMQSSRTTSACTRYGFQPRVVSEHDFESVFAQVSMIG